MSARSVICCLLGLAVVALLPLAWAYLAGGAYYLLSQAIPSHIDLDTWRLYWEAYSHDPAQRRRLLLAAVLPALPLLVIVVAVTLALRPAPRLLYGDARWATTDEIHEAGLL